MTYKPKFYKQTIRAFGFRAGAKTTPKTVVSESKTGIVNTTKQFNKERRVNKDGGRQIIYNLEGNVDERSYMLLNLFGMGYTMDYWISLGKKYNIKYPVVICIAKADSHLGLALKSKNNIGNVGNNDRGDTKEFDTMYKGIEAMFYTLSMKSTYQKHNHTIGELSQGGRTALGIEGCGEKGTYCYASSPDNWNINVLNCLDMIYDKPKDENFRFRLDQCN